MRLSNSRVEAAVMATDGSVSGEEQDGGGIKVDGVKAMVEKRDQWWHCREQGQSVIYPIFITRVRERLRGSQLGDERCRR